ncbi:MAG TPA: hypothetical protein VFA94_09915 [Acidimicrobiales bacterium]|nr:hypothetical protein [Acidimicrobiales bacterium]
MTLAGRVFVVLDPGPSTDAAEVARLLAEAGASVLTVHQDDRPPDGRGVLVADPTDSVDVETATTMAAELFGPVDAVVDLADLPPGAAQVVSVIRDRFAGN